MSSVLKATTENKATSVTTHFKEINNREQLVYCLKLLSNVTHMLQFLHQMFNLFALLRDDPLKPATLLTNGAIDETMQQFPSVSDDCLLQLVDCRESSKLINHMLKVPQTARSTE